jgi:hypothetical protein
VSYVPEDSRALPGLARAEERAAGTGFRADYGLSGVESTCVKMKNIAFSAFRTARATVSHD